MNFKQGSGLAITQVEMEKRVRAKTRAEGFLASWSLVLFAGGLALSMADASDLLPHQRIREARSPLDVDAFLSLLFDSSFDLAARACNFHPAL